MVGVVAEGAADLVNGEVDAALEVNERGVSPEMFLDLLARDDRAGVSHQQKEHLEWLRLQLHGNARLEKFAGGRIDFERTKAQLGRSRMRRGHQQNLHGGVNYNNLGM